MSLTKGLVPVAFKSGLSGKKSDKLTLPGEFLQLDDCVRRKVAEIQKRYGYTALSVNILGGGTLSAGSHLDVFNDDLIAICNGQLYSWVPSQNGWLNKGLCATAQVDLDPLVRTSGTQTAHDMAASAAGLTCVVYEDTSLNACYSIFDDTTGTAIVYQQMIESGLGMRPKVITLADRFLIGYLRPNASYALKFGVIPFNNPTVTFSPVATGIAVGSDLPWDLDHYAATGHDEGVFVAHNGTTAVMGMVSTAAALIKSFTLATTPVVTMATVVADSANARAFAFVGSTSGNLVGMGYTPYPGQSISSFNTTVSTASSQVTAAINGTNIIVYVDNKNATSTTTGTSAHQILKYTVDTTTTYAFAGGVALTSIGLASKAFVYNGRVYATCCYDTTLQPTYFLVRDDGYVFGRVLGGNAGGLVKNTAGSAVRSGLPRFTVDSQGRYSTVGQVRNKLTISGDGTTLAAAIGLQRVSYTMGARINGAQLNRTYHIAGGLPLNYDGTQVVEHNFFLYPEFNASGTSVASTGGLLPKGHVWTYCWLYEWYDAQGQIHRSTPSIAQTVSTVGNGADTGWASLAVSPLPITNRSATSVRVVLYMSMPDVSSVLYRYAEGTNNPSADYLSFAFVNNGITTATGQPLNVQEILYTTGGVVDNVMPPTSKVVHVHKGRLFAAAPEGIYFTKSSAPGEACEFQDTVIVPTEQDGGDVTAFASMDEKLIVFKERHVYYMSGEGPTDTGQQNDYFVPIRVAHDVGTLYPRSVVTMPKGVMFQSDKGVYMLTRGMQITYVGAGVEAYNQYQVTSAILMADQDEVRFTTLGGPCLVYNYLFDQWSVFTNYDAVGACLGLGNTYLHMKADGSVQQEVAGSYSDNGTPVTMGITTGWLALAGMQGYGRVYKALFLGDFVSDTTTTVNIAYNYENSYTQTATFNTVTGLAPISGTGGANIPVGTSSSVYQFVVQPSQQKCQAIKFQLTDSGTGASFNLLGLTLEVGRKYGAFKLPNQRNL